MLAYWCEENILDLFCLPPSVWTPKFKDWRSPSIIIVTSQVVLGRPMDLLQSSSPHSSTVATILGDNSSATNCRQCGRAISVAAMICQGHGNHASKVSKETARNTLRWNHCYHLINWKIIIGEKQTARYLHVIHSTAITWCQHKFLADFMDNGSSPVNYSGFWASTAISSLRWVNFLTAYTRHLLVVHCRWYRTGVNVGGCSFCFWWSTSVWRASSITCCTSDVQRHQRPSSSFNASSSSSPFLSSSTVRRQPAPSPWQGAASSWDSLLAPCSSFMRLLP